MSRTAVANDRFLRTLAGQPVDQIPVWFMRQAGRYLPEYRAVREGVSFLDLCRRPELAATVTLQPIDAFGFDAAILFSDILVPAPAMGLELSFDEGSGPHLSPPLRQPADLARLRRPDVGRDLHFVADAITEIDRRLAGRCPLIGFAGAPWTFATYLVEGGGSKSFRWASAWILGDPVSFGRLLDFVTDVTIDYLELQVEAGVHALQLFESWGGWLSAPVYASAVLPRIQRIFERFRGRVPTILYLNGSAQHLETMAASGADAIGVDWRLPLDDVRRRSGNRVVLQGNLDPCLLYAPESVLVDAVRRVLAEGAGGPHVFNLGHGILPDAPVDAVRTVVTTVAEWRPARRAAGGPG